jgi:hypothetical protein
VVSIRVQSIERPPFRSIRMQVWHGVPADDVRAPYVGCASRGRTIFQTGATIIARTSIPVLSFRPTSFIVARFSLAIEAFLTLGLVATIPLAARAQTLMISSGRANSTFTRKPLTKPWVIAGFAAYAGFLQEISSRAEWGQGAGAYGQRLATTAAW